MRRFSPSLEHKQNQCPEWIAIAQENGTYKIVSALNPELALDAWGGSSSNGTRIDVYANNDTLAQRWSFEPTKTERESIEAEAELHRGDLANGSYRIYTALDVNKALDVSGASRANSAKIQIYSSNGTAAQTWVVSHDEKGYVSLKNAASGKMLDVSGGGTSSGTAVPQYESNNTLAQKWIARTQDDGSVVLVSALARNIMLDVSGASKENGAPAQIWEANATSAQAWTFENIDEASATIKKLAAQYASFLADGTYAFASKTGNSQTMDVRDGSRSDGAAVQIYTSNMTGAQQWTVEHDAEGFVRIKNASSQKYLSVSGESIENGTSIVQQSYSDNNPSQQFITVPANAEGNSRSGFFLVSALHPQKVVDVCSGNSQPGTSLQLYALNNTPAQQFIARSTSPVVAPCEDIVPSDWFRISPANNHENAIDISGGSKSNGANAQLWQKNGTLAQLFSFKYENGYYTIACAGSGKILDVTGSNIVAPTNIQQWQGINTANQLFSATKNPDGSFTFINKATGLSLSCAKAEGTSGTNIQADYDSASSNARFFLDEQQDLLSDGIYSLSPTKGSNRALDVTGGSKSDGANIQVYNGNNSYAQKWKLTKAEGEANTYTLESICSDKFLACDDSGNVCQKIKASDQSQYWTAAIEENGAIALKNAEYQTYLSTDNGSASGANVYCSDKTEDAVSSFYLISVSALSAGMKAIQFNSANSFALDVSECSYANGANIQIYSSNDTGAQKWNLRQNSDSSYSIFNAETGKALDVASGHAFDGANIQQWESNGTAAQRWFINYDHNGGFVMRSALDASLVLSAADISSGENIQLAAYTGNANQLFALPDTTYSNDTVLGIKRGQIVSYLESHLYDGYYLGPPLFDGILSRNVHLSQWRTQMGWLQRHELRRLHRKRFWVERLKRLERCRQ